MAFKRKCEAVSFTALFFSHSLVADVATSLHNTIDNLFIFDDDQTEPETPESRVVLED